jgi:hypothetical protein
VRQTTRKGRIAIAAKGSLMRAVQPMVSPRRNHAAKAAILGKRRLVTATGITPSTHPQLNSTEAAHRPCSVFVRYNNIDRKDVQRKVKKNLFAIGTAFLPSDFQCENK